MFNVASNIALTGRYPNLGEIAIPKTKVTGVAVRGLVAGLEGKLERLNLDWCMSVSSDAVEWARQQGVCVSHVKLDKSSKSGRRLRDVY